MKYIFLVILIIVAIYTGSRAFTLRHGELTGYGWGYFTGNLIIFIFAVALILFIIFRYFRKKS